MIEVKAIYLEAASINLTSSTGLTPLAKMQLNRNGQFYNVLRCSLPVRAKIDDKELLHNLRRRIIQQTEILKKTINRDGSDIKIKFQNDSTLTWEKAITDLIKMQNSNIHVFTGPSYLTIDELISVAYVLSETTTVSYNELCLYIPERFQTNKISPKNVFNLQLPAHLFP